MLEARYPLALAIWMEFPIVVDEGDNIEVRSDPRPREEKRMQQVEPRIEEWTLELLSNGYTLVSDDLGPDGKAFNLYLSLQKHHGQSSGFLKSDQGIQSYEQ
jgi:hypothetical protein